MIQAIEDPVFAVPTNCYSSAKPTTFFGFHPTLSYWIKSPAKSNSVIDFFKEWHPIAQPNIAIKETILVEMLTA